MKSPVYDPTKPFSYDYTRLEQAWGNNDSSYVRRFITQSDTLSFTQFADVMFSFAGITNFTYGYLDVEGTIDSRYTARQKENLMKNIRAVNLIYVNSCLFMDKKLDLDDGSSIGDKFESSSRLLTPAELRQVKIEITNICNKRKAARVRSSDLPQ